MPRNQDLLYGINYSEQEEEEVNPDGIDPATYKRNFALAKQIIEQAVPPGKKVSKENLIRLVRGYRADISELPPLINLKNQILKLDNDISVETDESEIAKLTAERNNLQNQFNAQKLPDIISAPGATIKRLRRGMSISGPDACKSLTIEEIKKIIAEVEAERSPTWSFITPEEPDLP